MAQTVAAKHYPPPNHDAAHHVETFALGKQLSAFVCSTHANHYELHIGDPTKDRHKPQIAGVDFWTDKTPPIHLMGYPTSVAIHNTNVALAFATGHLLTGTMSKSTKTGNVRHATLRGTTVPHSCMQWVTATEVVFAGVPQNGDGEIVVVQTQHTPPRAKSIAVMTRPPSAVRSCDARHTRFAVLDIGNTVQVYTRNVQQNWVLSHMVVNVNALCALSDARLVAKEVDSSSSAIAVYDIQQTVPKIHLRVPNGIAACFSHSSDDLFAIVQEEFAEAKLMRLRNVESNETTTPAPVCVLADAPDASRSLSLVHNDDGHVLVHFQRGPLSWAVRAS